MNIAPLAVKAGQYSYPWGFGFDFSGETKFTSIETKNTSSSVRMTCDMANWVNENGYNRACVKGICEYCDDDYGTCFTGYWNPDIY